MTGHIVVGTTEIADHVAAESDDVERVRTIEEVTDALSGTVDGVIVADGVEGQTPVETSAIVREHSAAPLVVAAEDVPERAASAVGVDRLVPAGEESPSACARRALTAVRELDRQARTGEKRLADSLPVVCLVVDADLEVRYWNDALADATGYTRHDLSGRALLDLLPPSDYDRATAAIETARDGRTDSFETALVGSDGSHDPYEIRVGPHEDGVVVVGVDRSERREFVETLDNLHRTTRELVRSESPEEVARRVVDAATVLVETGSASVSLFDDEAGTLEEVASVHGGREEFPDQDRAWDAFVGGETMVREGESLDSGKVWSEVMLPLGRHGLVALSVDAGEGLSDRTLELAETLAANAVVALDRAAREEELRERDQMLRERTARLERVDEVNERIRRISHELMGATSRAEIETIVCDGLAAADRFAFVWLGQVGRDGIEPSTWAGSERGYLETVANVRAGDASATDAAVEPSLRAAATGESVTVQSVAGQLREGEWQREALSREYQSVLSLPLVHGGVRYGVLSVYAGTTGTFDGETRAVLDELVATIANAIRIVDQRRTLLSDRQVELAFEIPDGATTLFAFTDVADCTLTVDRVVSQTDSTVLAYGTVTGLTAEAFADAVGDAVGIRDGRVLAETDDQLRVELAVTGLSVIVTVAEYGGQFDELVAESGSGTVSMTLSARADVNGFIDRFTERYPDSTLLRRRERNHSETNQSGPALTDRQREVLETAFYSGFFEWPRESTGEEVADTLGVSSPTFQEHLRHALREAVAEYVADESL